MKFLKYLVLFILIVIVIGLIFGSAQPNEYSVKRSTIIKAPIATVFETINDLKTWKTWGPWHEKDSTIIITYGEKTIGEGATDSWTSKDGPGSMKIIKATPNERIEIDLQFGDFEPTQVNWDFEQVNDGTKITWEMKETKAPFIFKFYAALSGGWDKMFGPMEEKGLANIKKLIENKSSLKLEKNNK